MLPNIDISESLFARVQSFAIPLVDTFETVMHKALDALQAQNGNPGGATSNSARTLNPAAAPNLSFTTVHSILLNGKRMPPAETYWNNLLRAVIIKANETLSTEELTELVICNNVVGKKEDNGYNYLKEAGISVQATEANKAWKATYLVAKAIKLPLEVDFSWQENPKAAMPSQHGKFVLAWD